MDARTAKPGDLFTYSVPPDLELKPGHLVRVPFGPRTLHGLVARLMHEPNVDYTKPVLGLVHPEPLVTDTQLELARWLSDYYMAPPFDAIAPMLPPGLRARSTPLIRLRPDAPQPERLSSGARRLLDYMRQRRRPARVASLARLLGPWVPDAAQALVRAGLAQELAEEPPARSGRRAQRVVRPVLERRELLARAEQLTRAPRQAALARQLAEPAGAAYLAAQVSREFGASALAALVGKGIVTVESEPASPDEPTVPASPALLPTPAQAAALKAINVAQDALSPSPRTFLLQGVTGSGKTEVYLQALAHCLSLGKRAIVLVPELSLTPQTVERFEARFPGQVGVLHSGLSRVRQSQEWWGVHDGERGVVIGSRSAIFAPQPRLGLIVLDEEHEWTYKQTDASPRYHARQVALKLAELTGAVVVLGSATPDVASAYEAERGAYARLRLSQRIARSGAPTPMAEVDVVDMREELKAGNRSVFSRDLAQALHETVSAGRQAMLFLNRRGAASVVECRSCGHVLRCWRCSTAYTYHVAPDGGGVLVCHHCNRKRRVPSTCPRCRSARIRYLGLGTQRLVEEVGAMLPGVRVLRWDRDAAPTAVAHARLLACFADGEADVLVGTQMIAKGLDMPSVTLVGVVLADVGLHVPDFRAPERTFQVLTQVAGRAGRGASPGRVIIQTYVPDHYAIQAAASQDYDAFYAQEIVNRRMQASPPVTRLVRLLVSHTDKAACRREAYRFASALRRVIREWDMTGVDVVGPAPTYPPRVRSAWRWHLMVRAADPRLLLDKVSIPPGWFVDVDPVDVI